MSYKRVFFALEFKNELKDRLSYIQKRVRELSVEGSFVSPENFHLTIKFLGEVDIEDISAISKYAKKACANIKPFNLQLGGIGSFLRYSKHIVWIGLQGQLMELEELHGNLEDNLYSLGYKSDMKKYAPHITLARRVVFEKDFWCIKKNIKVEPYVWEASELVLLESTKIDGKLKYLPLETISFL